ncbi:TraB family-domain-containing protein [Pavlovales sp. CCMP2436]|nr:TraB family-domain-containing protein [Pavlovales sp. CCMP2436]
MRALAQLLLCAPALSGVLPPAQARAFLFGRGGLPATAALVERGRLVVWERDSLGVASHGEAGAGWPSATAADHNDPASIILIGTSHIVGAAESAEAVRELIAALRPDAVVVELCRSRRGLMYAPSVSAEGARSPFEVHSESNSAGGKLTAVTRTLQLGGASSLALRLLLARTAKRTMEITSDTATDAAPDSMYADFVAARESAERINATLVLGDRPIEITFERAWLAMGTRERLRLLQLGLQLALGRGTPQSRAADGALDGADGEDALGRMAAVLVREFPALYGALVTERDTFLSLTCKSSRAVSGKFCVVCVMGLGHVAGVSRCLAEDHSGEFKQLTRTPRRERAKLKVLGVPAPLFDRLLADSAIALGLFAAVKLSGVLGGP